MSLKQNILYSIKQSRQLLDGLVAKMNSDSDWMYQAHPTANHPLWVIGHIGLADNMFLEKIDASKSKKPEGWDDLFWFGSEISDDRSKYPDPKEVVAYYQERRETLLEELEKIDDEFLTNPTPEEGMFADAPNMAQLFFFAAFHEGLHTGQFTIASRGLGNDPLFTPS